MSVVKIIDYIVQREEPRRGGGLINELFYFKLAPKSVAVIILRIRF